MDNRISIWLTAVAGAIAGAAVGYLYFTPSGRRLREDLEPALRDLSAELQKTREVAARASVAVDDGLEFVRDTGAGPRGERPFAGPAGR